jgi:NAD-dependent SIR2 family protein deacetylase
MTTRALLVVTGAGISVASGIPTFRGADDGAFWDREDMSRVTRAYFEHDPLEAWRFHLGLFGCVFGAHPNIGHTLLADFEGQQRGPFLLVTQNIDSLHERAGSRALVKVHGSMDRVRCSRDGCAQGAPSGVLPLDLDGVRDELADGRVPRCGLCGAPLRPHVLWFDESYGEHEDYGFERTWHFARSAETILFVGTSFSVGITEILTRIAADSGARTIVVDPRPVNVPPFADIRRGEASDVLAGILDELQR